MAVCSQSFKVRYSFHLVLGRSFNLVQIYISQVKILMRDYNQICTVFQKPLYSPLILYQHLNVNNYSLQEYVRATCLKLKAQFSELFGCSVIDCLAELFDFLKEDVVHKHCQHELELFFATVICFRFVEINGVFL